MNRLRVVVCYKCRDDSAAGQCLEHGVHTVEMTQMGEDGRIGGSGANCVCGATNMPGVTEAQCLTVLLLLVMGWWLTCGCGDCGSQSRLKRDGKRLKRDGKRLKRDGKQWSNR